MNLWHQPQRLWRWLALFVLLGAGIATLAWPDDLAIWKIVDQGCRQTTGTAPAGLTCHPELGAALLKDHCGRQHYLWIPLARRSGIESDDLQQDSEPNYFAGAWQARQAVVDLSQPASPDAPLDLNGVGLTINSAQRRSQNQLHIHLDWMRPEVLQAVRALPPSATRLELLGQTYQVRHLSALTPTPFQWAARYGDAPMAETTLALVSDGAGAWWLLQGRYQSDRLKSGHAEDLMVPKVCP